MKDDEKDIFIVASVPEKDPLTDDEADRIIDKMIKPQPHTASEYCKWQEGCGIPRGRFDTRMVARGFRPIGSGDSKYWVSP